MLAVQAQDLRAARLAVRARATAVRACDVDRALTESRSLVVGWLARGTLHLVAREDYAWLFGLTARGRLAGNARRLRQEGVSPAAAERAVAVVERALAAAGPLTRRELGERLESAGVPTQGQALVHLLALAAFRAVCVLGPVRDGAQAFALAREWLGAQPRSDLTGDARDRALAELARRYLIGHGPATAADLAGWSGLALGEARAGVEAIARELVEVGDGLVDLARRPAAPERVAPRLLGAFDPWLLGWKDRGFAVAAEFARRVHPGGGMLRAVATDDAVAVGTWTARRAGGRLSVALEPFEPLAPELQAALGEDAADVARFEGLAGGRGVRQSSLPRPRPPP